MQLLQQITKNTRDTMACAIVNYAIRICIWYARTDVHMYSTYVCVQYSSINNERLTNMYWIKLETMLVWIYIIGGWLRGVRRCVLRTRIYAWDLQLNNIYAKTSAFLRLFCWILTTRWYCMDKNSTGNLPRFTNTITHIHKHTHT